MLTKSRAQIFNNSLVYYDLCKNDSSFFFTSIYIEREGKYIETAAMINGNENTGDFLVKNKYPYLQPLKRKNGKVMATGRSTLRDMSGIYVYKKNVRPLFYLNGKEMFISNNPVYEIAVLSLSEISNNSSYITQVTNADTSLKIGRYTFSCYEVTFTAKDSTSIRYTHAKPYEAFLDVRKYYFDKKHLIPVYIIRDYLRQNQRNEQTIIKLSRMIDCSL